MDKEEPDPPEAEDKRSVSTRQPLTTRRSSSPTMTQAFIWGFLAAAFGSLLAWLGKLLSDNPYPPPPVDSLHGLPTPIEMDKQIDIMLAGAQAALGHDQNLVGALGFIIVGACLLSLIGALFYILGTRRSSQPSVSGRRKFLVICGLIIVPIATSSGLKIIEDRLFHARPVAHSFSNVNTWPEVVPPGARVDVRIPVSMQSFKGHYEVKSFSLTSSMANLSDGNRVPIKLANPDMKGEDASKRPDKTVSHTGPVKG